MKMWEAIIPLIPEIVAVVLGFIATLAVRKKWIKEDLAKKLEGDISGAVTEVYDEYVKAKKKGNEDGKLTDEEKKVARDMAIAKVKEIGKTKGVDYAKEYGLPLIKGLIEKYVTKKKEGTE